MSEGNYSPEIDPTKEGPLDAYFEPVVVETPRVIKFVGSAKRIVTTTENYQGYRLKNGVVLTPEVIALMRQHGVEPATLYVESVDGSITHIPLREGAVVNRRKANGQESDMGKLQMKALRMQNGGVGFFQEGEPYMDFGASPQRISVKTTGEVKQVVIRTTKKIEKFSETKAPHATIAARYHITPGTANIAA